MKTEFEVTFEKNSVYQARLVLASDEKEAEAYFRTIEPEARFIGVSENQCGHKPGIPIEEVPDNWNRIAFDERYDSDVYNTTTLYFTAPRAMLGGKYPEAVSAEISIEFPVDHPLYHEASVMISPTNAEGSDYDWCEWPIDAESFDKLMRLSDETPRHSINVGFSTSDTEHDETQFDLEDPSDTVELVNLILQFFAENHFDNPVVTYIEEA